MIEAVNTKTSEDSVNDIHLVIKGFPAEKVQRLNDLIVEYYLCPDIRLLDRKVLNEKMSELFSITSDVVTDKFEILQLDDKLKIYHEAITTAVKVYHLCKVEEELLNCCK